VTCELDPSVALFLPVSLKAASAIAAVIQSLSDRLLSRLDRADCGR
jgi:hypothetical protein